MNTNVIITPSSQVLVLNFGSFVRHLEDDEFTEFCRINRELRIERTSTGDLIIMSPTGGETGHQNFNLTGQLSIWVDKDGTGLGFDSSTGFTLANGAKRSPDIAWVRRDRWERLSTMEREGFPPLCPDFIVEIRSRSDSLSTLQEKMEEYLANGMRLGWLIDPLDKKVYIYQPDLSPDCLENPHTLSGEPVLRGFVLNLGRVW